MKPAQQHIPWATPVSAIMKGATLTILAGFLFGLFITGCGEISKTTIESPQESHGAPTTITRTDIPLAGSAAPNSSTPVNDIYLQAITTQASAQVTPTDDTRLDCDWPPSRILIVSIDSLRPDAVRDTAQAPFLLAQTHQAAFTWDAQTISPSITLPAHLSMLSGYDATTHGQIINKLWQTPEAKTTTTTIFERAKSANLTTALFSGKGHLLYISRAGNLDHAYINKAAEDIEIATKAAEYTQANDFALMFINLANVDRIGHTYGWMSDAYLQAVGRAEAALQVVLSALEDRGWLSSTLLIITSDHGGSGTSHGDSSYPANKTIPWMISGPCIKPGHAIAQDVYIFDTAVMALWALGIEIPVDMDGKLVCEVFQSPVSMQCYAAQK